MKKLTTLLIACLTLTAVLNNFVLKAQAPGFGWAKGIGGTFEEEGKGVVADAYGNVYVTGYFKTASITFGSDTITSNGDYDVYIAKYDSSGNALWAKNWGGASGDFAYAVDIDAAGNIYVVGAFISPTFVIGQDTLINQGEEDLFVAKFDATGNPVWARSVGDSASEYSYSISIDGNNKIYITGRFESGTINFASNTLVNGGGNEFYLMKYDSDGNELWARSASGIGSDWGTGVVTDDFGNVYCTGYFVSTQLTFGTTTLNSNGSSDVFTVKYDTSGNFLWAVSGGGSTWDYGKSISVDASGNVYVTGKYASTTITFGSTTLSNIGGANNPHDIFVVKYDAAGNVTWAKSYGGDNKDSGNNIFVDDDDNIYLTGEFQSDSVKFGMFMLKTTGLYDVFLVKFDVSGNVVWANNAGGYSDDIGYGVTTDAFNHIYLTGMFYNAVAIFGTNQLVNQGATDIFIAKLSECKTLVSLGNDIMITTGDSIVLDAGSGHGTYKWNNGSTSQTLTVKGSTLGLGTYTYWVAVTDSNGCYGMDTIVISITAGIEDNMLHNNIRLYPNPADDYICLEFANTCKDLVIDITNVNGQAVYNTRIDNARMETTEKINISGYPKGVYFITIRNNDFVRNDKIIVE